MKEKYVPLPEDTTFTEAFPSHNTCGRCKRGFMWSSEFGMPQCSNVNCWKNKITKNMEDEP